MTMANDITDTMAATITEYGCPDVALLDVNQVAAMMGLHRATIFKLVACGKFLKPVKLGRASRWVKDELTAWIAAKCPPMAKWEAMNSGPGRKTKRRA